MSRSSSADWRILTLHVTLKTGWFKDGDYSTRAVLAVLAAPGGILLSDVLSLLQWIAPRRRLTLHIASQTSQTLHMTTEISRLSRLLLSLNHVTVNHRPLIKRTTSGRLADVWGPLDPDGCFSRCVGDECWTFLMEPLKTWPPRPDQHSVHPELISQPLGSSLTVTTVKFQLTAHSQDCDTHRGFHFIHLFMSWRHIKSEEMNSLFSVGEFHCLDSFLLSDHLIPCSLRVFSSFNESPLCSRLTRFSWFRHCLNSGTPPTSFLSHKSVLFI